jgi:tetratricopeptide (TPR) repeat protein
MGFARYFWLAEEALGGRDAEMDMLLRTEFLRTLAILKENDALLGFLAREAQVDTAVRWGMRALFFQSDPETALDVFDQVRRRWGKDAGKLGLAWSHLQFYRAVAQIRRGIGDDWLEARALLDRVESKADEVLAAPPETPPVRARRWQARILKGLVLNFRGYLDRQQGRYLEAVRNYQQSAMFQRRLGMAALAPTLTNLAYAMALTGEFHHARLMAEEAERLARRSGKEHMLALTLNVRALVEEYDGHYKTALRYTDLALEVASELPSVRVQGLIYLTRARAFRYLWSSLSGAERKREPELLDRALKDANQAVSLLRRSPVDRVEALLERGCICRETARQHHTQDKGKEAQQYVGKSRKDFERVSVLAGAIDLPRLQALAWTNLGWLYYYVDDTEKVDESLHQAYLPLPPDYVFPDLGPLPPIAEDGRRTEATLPYWSTLGKAEMLRAYVALDQSLASPNGDGPDDQLQEAVKRFTLSLAYDELVADRHFDLTRAEEGLHSRILQDSLSIGSLHQCAEEVAKEQGLEQPTRFQEFLTHMFGPAELWL